MSPPSLLVLAPDVELIPSNELAPEVRSKAECREGDVALTRPTGRTGSVLVDSATAELLALFRKPSTIVNAILQYSRVHCTDADTALERAFPVFEQLIAKGMLVPPPDARSGQRASALHPGTKVGRTILMGEIQRLEDVEVYWGRMDTEPVAVKIATDGSASGNWFVDQEARLLERLTGTPAPRLIETGTLDGRPWLTMEWCSGVPCTVRADELRPLEGSGSARRILDLCIAVARAYDGIHQRGILHGDVHPRNVLIQSNGTVRLIDFGLARDLQAGAPEPNAGRGGIGFFFDPDTARAWRDAKPLPPLTAAGEQYSIASLLYLLVTGKYYLDFSFDEAKAMTAAETEPMLPFSERGDPAWPALEGVLRTALSKEPPGRYSSVADFAASLAHVTLPDEDAARPAKSRRERAETAAAKELTRSLLADLRQEGMLRTGLSPGPTCSLNYGAAGLAYGLYRLACHHDDPDLLHLADRWVQSAIRRAESPDAFLNPEFGVTADTVGRASLFHGLPGVHLVAAMIRRAAGDPAGRHHAIEGFLQAARGEGRLLDLTLGRTGLLLGSALLIEGSEPEDGLPMDRVRRCGDEVAREIEDALHSLGPIAECSEVDYLGAAHGWAGLLHGLLRWYSATGRMLPAMVAARLEELALAAEPMGRGVVWPTRTARHLERPSDPPLPGWCNGSAGFVFLWSMAAKATNNPSYTELAERAGWSAWEHPNAIRSLCCGMAGRAYALLHLARETGDGEWVDRARQLGARAAAGDRDETPFRQSLFKGNMGIALLLESLADPEGATMPILESEGWNPR